jgi:DNA-binding GntR family transcriptional regulator
MNRPKPILMRTVSLAPPSALPRQSLVGSAVSALRKRIISGEFRDGEPLNQVVMAREYAISRIPLREAMRQLESEGLLEFQPGKGAVVSSLSISEIQEVIELRANLEPNLLAKAIPHLTPAVLNEASSILDEFDAALTTGKVAMWGEINWRFHSTICAPSACPLTMGILQSLHHLNQRYARVQISLTNWEQRAAREHRAILGACRIGTQCEAATMLREHILVAGDALLRLIKEERSESKEILETRYS